MGACPPEQTTTLQLIRSFVRYARANRSQLPGRQTYPCGAEHGLNPTHETHVDSGGGKKMMFHSRVAQTTILTTGSVLALMTAALGDHARAEGKLDASYTISFARIRVGDI